MLWPSKMGSELLKDMLLVAEDVFKFVWGEGVRMDFIVELPNHQREDVCQIE